MMIEATIFLSRHANKSLDRPALPVARHEEIRRRDEQVVLVRETPGYRRVTSTIHVFVVVHIMRGDPGERRITVKDREPIREPLVGSSVAKYRAMIMIMCDHAASEPKIATEPAKVDYETRLG